MKHTLLLPLILFSSMSFAQTAKDYFFPASDKNLSVYKTIDPQGNYENGSIGRWKGNMGAISKNKRVRNFGFRRENQRFQWR